MNKTFFDIAARYVAVAAALLLVFSWSLAPAEAGRDVKLQPIKKAPRVYSPQAIRQTRLEDLGIPCYSGTGIIDVVNEDNIIIDDMQFNLGANVSYRSESSKYGVPSSSFKPGVRVGYVLDSKRAITALWLLKNK